MSAVLEILLKAKDQASATLKGFSANVNKHSRAIQATGIAMLGTATAVGGAGLKMAGDYDTSMREVNTLLNLTETEFQSLKQSTMDAAVEVGKTPNEIAKALYQVVSAGVPAGDALAFVKTSAQAAVGGVTDTTTAVDGLTTVMNAFHMDASETNKVADIMFTTVKGGKTTFGELSSSMSQVAPIAASLGVEFEDVMAATATLTKQGTPTAQAMTQIRASLVALTKPSEDMKALLAEMGFESGEAALQTLGYQGTLDGLTRASGNNNQVLAVAFGRVEALNATLGLTGQNLEMAKADMEAMTRATDDGGAAMQAYDQMNKGAGRQMEQLKANLAATTIQIGNALMPVLMKVVDVMKPILESMGKWISDNPDLVKTLILVTGAVGGMLLVLKPAIALVHGLTAATHLLTMAKKKLTIENIKEQATHIKGNVLMVATKAKMAALTIVHGVQTAAVKTASIAQGLFNTVMGTGAVQAIVKLIGAMVRAGAAYLVMAAKALIAAGAAIGQAVAQVFAAHAWIPFAGIAIAGGLIATMLILFSRSKRQASQGLYTGGYVNEGGMFTVGEHGRETVYLPTGSAVRPGSSLAPQSSSSQAGGNTTVVLKVGFMLGDHEDGERLIDYIQKALRERQRPALGRAIY